MDPTKGKACGAEVREPTALVKAKPMVQCVRVAPLPAPPHSPSSPRLAGWVGGLQVWGGLGGSRRAVGCGYGVSSKHRWVSGCAGSGYGVHSGSGYRFAISNVWVGVWAGGVQGVRYRVQVSGCRVGYAGHEVQDTGR